MQQWRELRGSLCIATLNNSGWPLNTWSKLLCVSERCFYFDRAGPAVTCTDIIIGGSRSSNPENAWRINIKSKHFHSQMTERCHEQLLIIHGLIIVASDSTAQQQKWSASSRPLLSAQPSVKYSHPRSSHICYKWMMMVLMLCSITPQVSVFVLRLLGLCCLTNVFGIAVAFHRRLKFTHIFSAWPPVITAWVLCWRQIRRDVGAEKRATLWLGD